MLLLIHISTVCFSTYVPRKISEKNYLGKSNIALFTREICNIRSEDSFYLERTDFGKEIHKRDREFR